MWAALDSTAENSKMQFEFSVLFIEPRKSRGLGASYCYLQYIAGKILDKLKSRLQSGGMSLRVEQ